ncbi:hypothetical protein Tco_1436864 [Tanacetum coccineum]
MDGATHVIYGVLVAFWWSFAHRHAEKYVRKGRLNWPEGAASRESIKAVLKLPRLQIVARSIVARSIVARSIVARSIGARSIGARRCLFDDLVRRACSNDACSKVLVRSTRNAARSMVLVEVARSNLTGFHSFDARRKMLVRSSKEKC